MASDLLGAMRVEIIGDNTKLDKSIKTSEKNTETFAKKTTALGGTLSKMFAGIGFAVVTKKLFDLGAEASRLASSANEIKSKFSVVFGESADIIESWASTYSDSVGRSKTDTLDFLGVIGDTLKPLGFSKDAVDDMSKQVVALAGDLASFNNLPTAEVIAGIQSALVGNVETLRRYGVVANETSIKQEAINSGLWDGEGALTAQEKAQAILNITLAGTTDAQGDLLRTQEGTANTFVRLESASKDLKIELGKTINEGITPIAGATATLISRYVSWLEKTRQVKDAINEITDSGKAQTNSVDVLKESVVELTARLNDQLLTQKNQFSIVGRENDKQLNDAKALTQSKIDELKANILSTEQQIRSIKQLEQATLYQAAIEKKYAGEISERASIEKAASDAAVLQAKKQLILDENRGKFLKELIDIDQQVLAGTIAGNGEAEKKIQLQQLVNTLIEEGFRTEDSGIQNTLALAERYNVVLEDEIAITKESMSWDEKENALRIAYFKDLETKKQEAFESEQEGREESLSEWEEYYATLKGKGAESAASALGFASDLFSSLAQLSQATAQSQIDDIDRILNTRLTAIDAETQALLESLGLQEETKTEKLQRQLDEAILKGDEETAARLQDEIDRTAIIEEAEEAKATAIEEAEAEKAQIEYEGALASWKLQKLAAVANAAQALLTNYSQLGLIGGTIAAIPTAILTGVQLGILNQNKPVQTFATGGVVAGQNFVGDNVPAMVNSGEMILNQAQQARLFSMANGSTTNNNNSSININSMFSLGNESKINDAAKRLFPALQREAQRRGTSLGAI